MDIDTTGKKGRFVIRGCSSELWSLPGELAEECLAQLSRLDLVALAMVSRGHRFVAESHELRTMRFGKGNVEPYLYVLMQIHPDPSPRWFVLHPTQRLLKPVHSILYPFPESGSCFVKKDCGIYVIGGLINGKPTSQVLFLDCIQHTVHRLTPMNMARSGASASLVDGEKIYVFGGGDSEKWVEVYDMETRTWDLLSVLTPTKMPLKIQHSAVVMNDAYVHAVDEDGHIFFFSTRRGFFVTTGEKESNPQNRSDWVYLFGTALFCRGVGAKILCRFPEESVWKELKGLEELQQRHSDSGFDIIKLCAFSAERLAIFWESPRSLELLYAELSITIRCGPEGWEEVSLNIERSAAVLSLSHSRAGLNLLYADSIYVLPLFFFSFLF